MTQELQRLLGQIEAIKAEGRAITAGLSDAQFNWHPGPGRWSIAHCLQHLNVAVSKTLPAFDRAIAVGRSKGQLAPGPFHYGWFSRWMIGSPAASVGRLFRFHNRPRPSTCLAGSTGPERFLTGTRRRETLGRLSKRLFPAQAALSSYPSPTDTLPARRLP